MRWRVCLPLKCNDFHYPKFKVSICCWKWVRAGNYWHTFQCLTFQCTCICAQYIQCNFISYPLIKIYAEINHSNRQEKYIQFLFTNKVTVNLIQLTPRILPSDWMSGQRALWNVGINWMWWTCKGGTAGWRHTTKRSELINQLCHLIIKWGLLTLRLKNSQLHNTKISPHVCCFSDSAYLCQCLLFQGVSIWGILLTKKAAVLKSRIMLWCQRRYRWLSRTRTVNHLPDSIYEGLPKKPISCNVDYKSKKISKGL